MKITVFTCNQERHISLVRKLSDIADEVFAVHECRTLFLGDSPDYVYYSETMKQYFSKVMEAEKYYFGNIGFMPSNVRQVPLMRGDSREKEFTDEVALDYLNHLMDEDAVYDKLLNRDLSKFKDAYVG